MVDTLENDEKRIAVTEQFIKHYMEASVEHKAMAHEGLQKYTRLISPCIKRIMTELEIPMKYRDGMAALFMEKCVCDEMADVIIEQAEQNVDAMTSILEAFENGEDL